MFDKKQLTMELMAGQLDFGAFAAAGSEPRKSARKIPAPSQND
jgi:hypothetical protein